MWYFLCPSHPSHPNVSVRRIEASFRKRGNSLSGNPCLASLGPGCSADGRFGPDGQLHWYCKAGIAGVYAPRAVFLSLSSGPRCSASWLVWTRRLALLVLTLSLALCSSWCLTPQMPVILAGLDHRTVWRFTGAVLGQGFLHARCCATSVLVQTVLYTVWRFRSCSSSRSSISCCGTEAYSMQIIVFPQLLRYMWSTSPVMQAVQFPRWFAVLGHADDMPVVGNNRCLELDSVVLQGFRSCSSLVVFDISVVAGANSYGPDCSDEQCGRRLGYAYRVGPTGVGRVFDVFSPVPGAGPFLSCSTSSSTLSGSGRSSRSTGTPDVSACCADAVTC